MSTDSRANEMLNDWNPETASLLATLREHGFRIWAGSNGEESFRRDKFTTETAFLDELLACDEAWLYVTRNAKRESVKTPGKMVYREYGLFLVMGNSPGELVSDWGIPADADDAQAMEEATTEHYDKWEGKPQPKVRAGDRYPQAYK